MGAAAGQTKTKFSRDEPKVSAAPSIALWVNLVLDGGGVFVAWLELWFSFAEINPVFGQFFQEAFVSEVFRFWTKKAEALFSFFSVTGFADVSRAETDTVLFRTPDRMIFLAAVAAEVGAVQQGLFVLPAWGKFLCVKGNNALVGRLQRGQHLARPADELVQLEGKGRTTLWVVHFVGC